MTAAPLSTYRLQIAAGFTLHDAAELAGYLRDLGVDWYYLSPLLQAGEGSTHGYDVVDHGRVDAARGGRAGLDALGAAARSAGLGVLVDIVPNHMGVGDPAANAWWWEVLTHGPTSARASFFDIDWDAGGGRVRIPVLGETVEAAAESGALRVEDGELRYHEHRFPLAPGTADDAAAAEIVHARQHYELIDWRRASSDLNYRRFFAVNELAAIRVELPEVFEASHREVVRWVRDGLGAGVTVGLRVDHPDGLADPGGYLDALATATDGAYVLVEKILQHGERLPAGWATAGTTGYDALAEIDRVLVDPAGQTALEALDASLRAAGPLDWQDLTHDTRRAVADGILNAEVRRLARELPPIDAAEDAVAELLACFPVYRSYLPLGAEQFEAAVASASARRPDLAESLVQIASVLGDAGQPAAVRFQQTSGMVMAKGVEDNAFYRDTRLATLTEVGGEPGHFALPVDAFHDAQASRLAGNPDAMTTLTTHDTKRSEDTRARISVLAELPGEWADFIGRRRPLGDGAFENLLWQSIAGSWPRDREALHGYALKAAREAGGRTGWQDPDPGFEEELLALVDTAFDDPETRADLERIVERIAVPGRSNSLSAKLLQLTGPGVPDVYQGTELWDHSLVDPDNRRPVDYEPRRSILAELDAGALPPVDATGAAKLLVTSRALRARRDRPDLFSGYTPLHATGPAASHLIAADRGGAIPLATRLPVGLAAGGGWRDTELTVPEVPFRDALTGARHPGGRLPIARLLERYPVALLLPEEP